MQSIKLTNKSWLIGFGTEDAGLLFLINDDYLYLSTTKRLEFKSQDEVNAKFGRFIHKQTQQDTGISEINSFPIKHQDAVVVSIDPPLYTKGGNTVYAAGYWGMKYTNGWALTHCPKQDTIQSYETIGPYKNRLEALNQINSKNRGEFYKDEN